jgi:hypothetical protein
VAGLREHVDVAAAIAVGEEDPLPAVAALHDVVRPVGNDDAGGAGQAGAPSRDSPSFEGQSLVGRARDLQL